MHCEGFNVLPKKYKVHCVVVAEKEIDMKSSECMKSGFVSSQRGAQSSGSLRRTGVRDSVLEGVDLLHS